MKHLSNIWSWDKSSYLFFLFVCCFWGDKSQSTPSAAMQFPVYANVLHPHCYLCYYLPKSKKYNFSCQTKEDHLHHSLLCCDIGVPVKVRITFTGVTVCGVNNENMRKVKTNIISSRSIFSCDNCNLESIIIRFRLCLASSLWSQKLFFPGRWKVQLAWFWCKWESDTETIEFLYEFPALNYYAISTQLSLWAEGCSLSCHTMQYCLFALTGFS